MAAKTRFVLVGTLMRALDENDPTAANFMNQYVKVKVGVNTRNQTVVAAPTEIDGSNGGGGDTSLENLKMRASESGYVSQRWVSYPGLAGNGKSKVKPKEHSALSFPPMLNAQVCLVFESRKAYASHMDSFQGFYTKYFSYVFVMTETIAS